MIGDHPRFNYFYLSQVFTVLNASNMICSLTPTQMFVIILSETTESILQIHAGTILAYNKDIIIPAYGQLRLREGSYFGKYAG